MADLFDENLKTGAPLADRMRPINFDEYIGQEHILAKNKILRRAIEADKLFSMILWGPPGSGKTTLARLIANKTKSFFQPFSAVTSGIGDVRKALDEAKDRKKFHQQKLFSLLTKFTISTKLNKMHSYQQLKMEQ